MKPKTLVTLVVAVGCGLVAAFLMKQAQSGQEVEVEATVPVLVAEVDIPFGKRIVPAHVRFREMPVSLVPEGAITDVEQYEERALLSPAVAGEILKISKLGKVGEYGASMRIPEGMRVATIPVTAADTASSSLQPNDRVDVYVTYRKEITRPDGKRDDVTRTKTLLEFVQIFQVDSLTAANGGDETVNGNTKHISLLVTPEQATALTLAQDKGRLSVIWRNELDDAVVKSAATEEWFLEDIVGGVGGINGPEKSQPTTDLSDDADVADTEEPPIDFRGFLKGMDVSVAAEEERAVTRVEPKPTRQLWSMQIGLGGTAQTIEVPYENEQVSEPPAAEVDAAADAGNAAASASAVSAVRMVGMMLLGL